MSKYLLASAAVTALVGAAVFGAPYVAAQGAQNRYGDGNGEMTQSRQHIHTKTTAKTMTQAAEQKRLHDPSQCDGTGTGDGTGEQRGYGRVDQS